MNQFEKKCKSYGPITEGVDICFVNDYAVLRAEVDYGEETLTCKQEVEFFDNDSCPVQPLYFGFA